MTAREQTTDTQDREHRCDCGAVVCRLTARGVEIKCRRCKRVVVIPLASMPRE